MKANTTAVDASESVKCSLSKRSLMIRRSAEFPYKKLPVLEVDGVVLSQSVAIAHYLASQFGKQTFIA